ncbi:MAG: ParB N-terminal domain-containing protein [Rhizonema sp. NSF051]|nr:ParB N-terminal domain-containing protein [Rhizonema sp. NSF051]
MKLSTSLIAVKKITSTQSRSNFSDDDIEQTAKLILELEGVINPIVVRRTSLQSYEVIDGEFEYHAAARAREINPRKGEMIGVFIIEPENEELITKQIELLRKPKPALPSGSTRSIDKDSISTVTESRLINTETRITNIESRGESRLLELQAEFRLEIQKVNERLKEVETKLPKPIEPLEAVNTFSLPELTSKLKRLKVKNQIIERIISERQKSKFTSFSNIVERIDGLADKTMLKIIDSFSESIG